MAPDSTATAVLEVRFLCVLVCFECVLLRGFPTHVLGVRFCASFSSLSVRASPCFPYPVLGLEFRGSFLVWASASRIACPIRVALELCMELCPGAFSSFAP